jgi:hypothetical protein
MDGDFVSGGETVAAIVELGASGKGLILTFSTKLEPRLRIRN